MTRYVAICQRCGRTGSMQSTGNDKKPTWTPTVPGTCTAHKSGVHSPKWEKR